MNSDAAELIPIRLIMSVAIIGVISVLFTSGMLTLQTQTDIHQIDQQINDFKASIQVLMKQGSARDISDPLSSNGSKRTFVFHLPDNIEFLSFGGDNNIKKGLNENTSNQLMTGIFYQFQGKTKQVVWLESGYGMIQGHYVDDCWIPIKVPDPLILDHCGLVTVNVELIKMHDTQYLLMYS